MQSIKRKEKVCILTTVHPPFDTRIFHKQAKTLVRAGYDVTLIAQHEKDEVVDGVRIVALPKLRNRFVRIFCLTWRAFRLALRQQADIYHFHDPELLPIGVLLKLLTRAKVIYDVHEDVRRQILNKSWLPSWSRRFLVLTYALCEGICLPFIDRIVIAEDSYIKHFRDRWNVVAIRNYPLLSYFKLSRGTNAEGRPENTFEVFYVGGVTRLRGTIQLVEALRILKSDGYQRVRLRLVGPLMPPSLKTELGSLVQRYGLQEEVFIPGPVPHERVSELLAKAHVGIATLHPDPNYVESLPTKLFEYMAAGLPVVASNFPLWREIVEGNNCGLCVDPLDPKAIAEAVEYLLTHPEEAHRMGGNGRRAVEEKYNWEREGERLLKLYGELLKR